MTYTWIKLDKEGQMKTKVKPGKRLTIHWNLGIPFSSSVVQLQKYNLSD